MMPDQLSDQLCINTIRTLSMDAIQQANSGHPGTRWPWRPSPIVCGSSSFVSIQTIPSGPTATGSSSRPGMPPCCSTRCCI